MLGLGLEIYKSGRFSKNLFNPAIGTATSNGVTCTVAADGTITLNGTATSESRLSNALVALINLINGSKYILSSPVLSGSASSPVEICICDSPTRAYTADYFTTQNVGNAGNVITAGTARAAGWSSALQIVDVFFHITSGTTFANYTFKLQLEQNSVATSWEQY